MSPDAPDGDLGHPDDRSGDRRIEVTGSLDLSTAPALQATVGRLCAQGAPALVLDLSRLAFIDSCGLNGLLRARALCEEHGCALEIIPAESSARRVFELTRLVDRLPFRRSAERAGEAPR